MSLVCLSWVAGLLAIVVPGCTSQHAAVPGRSVQRRPIVTVKIRAAHPRAPVLVVGCIHGNEPAGIAIARAVRRAGSIPRIDLWLIDDLNPDGVAAGTRQNADGVDLNRNFPWSWRGAGHPAISSTRGRAPSQSPRRAWHRRSSCAYARG